MAHKSLRSAIVLVLLLGTLALAVPYISNTIDAWLFSEGSLPDKPKWNTQRPEENETLRPANPTLVPPGKQLSHNSLPDDEGSSPPFAFDFQDESPRPDRPAEARGVDDPESPPAKSDGLSTLQRELEDLGAAYLTVERDGDRYECRTLFPLSPESSYQKAFSAIGSTPEAALEQVLAEVRNWQRASSKKER